MRSFLVGILVCCWVTGCVTLGGRGGGFERAELPYSYPPPVQSAPKHPIKLALFPIVDQRSTQDGLDSAHRYRYRGKNYGFTDLRSLKKGLSHSLTTILGRHLAQSALFRQILIVSGEDQAVHADLLLYAKVTRARAYVERPEQPVKKVKAVKAKRQVMSEFILSDVRLVDPKYSSSVLFESDFGWSVFEERKVDNEVEAAWKTLGETIKKTLEQLVRALRVADLSTKSKVLKEVRFQDRATEETEFGAFVSTGPPGWHVESVVKTSTAPAGWISKNTPCSMVTLRANQTWRFDRVLGPYRPSVVLWRCPSSIYLRYNVRADHPAEYLGTTKDGGHYFLRALGKTNWKACRTDVRAHLNIRSPTQRYIFDIRPAGSNGL